MYFAIKQYTLSQFLLDINALNILFDVINKTINYYHVNLKKCPKIHNCWYDIALFKLIYQNESFLSAPILYFILDYKRTIKKNIFFLSFSHCAQHYYYNIKNYNDDSWKNRFSNQNVSEYQKNTLQKSKLTNQLLPSAPLRQNVCFAIQIANFAYNFYFFTYFI